MRGDAADGGTSGIRKRGAAHDEPAGARGCAAAAGAAGGAVGEGGRAIPPRSASGASSGRTAWSRRALVRAAAGVALAMLAGIRPAPASGSSVGRPGGGGSREREARRRWVLAQMDDAARERQRCAERFRNPRQVSACEAEHERRYRALNELYIELSRD